jgi:sensor domain CHASE-containing protein
MKAFAILLILCILLLIGITTIERDMSMSKEELLNINDVDQLKDLKEQLKNQVIGNITWQERINLYKQIQLINDRIQNLILMKV